jgi:hypothetical protein
MRDDAMAKIDTKLDIISLQSRQTGSCKRLGAVPTLYEGGYLHEVGKCLPRLEVRH